MTCHDNESLILTERDGALTKEQSAALSDHVAACPACQRFRGDLAAALTTFKTDIARVPVPDADEAWRDLQSRLHAPAKRTKKNPLAPLIWFGAPLAAAAAIALMLFTTPAPTSLPATVPAAKVAVSAVPAPPPPPTMYAAMTIPGSEDSLDDTARADFVEAGDANASTMVYVDKDSGWLVVWATNIADTKTSG